MKRTSIKLIMLALAVVLAMPAFALAKGGQGNGQDSGKAPKAVRKATTKETTSKGAGKAGKEARKADKAAAKEARKAEKAAEKEARTSEQAVVADDGDLPEGTEPTDSVVPTESVEPTVPTGAGIPNAFDRITANLEKSLAKVAAGQKKQVPPGLVRVWMKFAAWLGVDPSTMPGAGDGDTGEPPTPVEPTSTVEPTTTVEPVPPTDVPTSSVEPTSEPAL